MLEECDGILTRIKSMTSSRLWFGVSTRFKWELFIGELDVLSHCQCDWNEIIQVRMEWNTGGLIHTKLKVTHWIQPIETESQAVLTPTPQYRNHLIMINFAMVNDDQSKHRMSHQIVYGLVSFFFIEHLSFHAVDLISNFS